MHGERLWLAGLIGALTMSGMFVGSILNMFISIGPKGMSTNDWIIAPIVLMVAGMLGALAFGRLRLLFGYKPLVRRKFGFPYRRGIMWYEPRSEGMVWFMNVVGVVVVIIGLMVIPYALSKLT